MEHFGSLGILSSSTDALVRVYAPSTGIVPVCHKMMVVPPKLDAHSDEGAQEDNEEEKDNEEEEEDYSDSENDESDQDDWGTDEWDNGWSDDSFGYDGSREDYSLFESNDDDDDADDNNANDNTDDKWSKLSAGERVGWKFDHKPRFVRGEFVDPL